MKLISKYAGEKKFMEKMHDKEMKTHLEAAAKLQQQNSELEAELAAVAGRLKSVTSYKQEAELKGAQLETQIGGIFYKFKIINRQYTFNLISNYIFFLYRYKRLKNNNNLRLCLAINSNLL